MEEVTKVSEVMKVSASSHEKRLRQMPCVLSGLRPVTLHHCKGGSMLDLGPEFGHPGIARKANPFFQIPLHAMYHVGQYGIDTGMGRFKTKDQWELAFGTQLDFLREVNGQLPYDIFEQARLWISSE